jgi:uncharacterized membrane protein HdeD (DUF308 family)
MIIIDPINFLHKLIRRLKMTAEAIKETGTPWWLVLLEGIALIIIGILFLLQPGMTLGILIQILGIYWLIKGLFSIIMIFQDSSMWGWKLFVGILGILAGIVVLRHPLWSTILVPTVAVVILGIEGIIIGIVEIIQAFRGAGWGVGLLGVLSIIIGIILLANPIFSAVVFAYLLAIVAIVGGIVAIFLAFRVR